MLRECYLPKILLFIKSTNFILKNVFLHGIFSQSNKCQHYQIYTYMCLIYLQKKKEQEQATLFFIIKPYFHTHFIAILLTEIKKKCQKT